MRGRYLAALVFKGGNVFCKGAGVPMGAEHLLFVGHAKLVEGGAARGHYIPVAGTSHDDCYFHLILRFEVTKLLSICDTYKKGENNLSTFLLLISFL